MKIHNITATQHRWARSKEIMAQRYWAMDEATRDPEKERQVVSQYLADLALEKELELHHQFMRRIGTK